jgi:PAS domain S-box-containing protein
MASPPVQSPSGDLRQLTIRVLNLRIGAYALSTIGALLAAVVSESSRAAILSILAALALAHAVFFRKESAALPAMCLTIDAIGAGVLWWLFGPTAAVDFVLFYVVAAASLLLSFHQARWIVGLLVGTTLVQLVIHIVTDGNDLPLFHVHEDAGVIGEILFRLALVLGSTVMFFTIARLLERFRAETGESERRFRNLVEASPDAIVVHNGGAVLYANDAAAELIGALEPADLLGLAFQRFVHADSLELARSTVAQVLQGETVGRTEMKLVRLDGEEIHVETVGIPTTFNGKPASQAILRNVTDRHDADRALRKSEERYRSFFEGVPTPLYRTTPEGRILDANAALVELLGYPDKQSLLDIQVTDAYVRPADRSQSQAKLHERGLLEAYEQELIRFDGSTIWVQDTTRIVTDSDGSILYYEGALVDITERKAAQETTRRLIRILEATPDFVIIADEDGRILYGNQSAREFAGVGEGDAWELTVRDVLATEERATLEEILSSDVWTGILHLSDSENRQTPVSTVVINHRDSAGGIEYFSAVARDISDRIATEKRLEDLIRSKDDFVASVSHELRTPLTAVVGLAHELREGWSAFTREELTEFIALIADQSSEVANIVEDLLVAARADIGKIVISAAETVIDTQVEAVLTALGPTGSANISVLSDSGARAMADESRVRQIIRNLVTNAIRYGGDQIELAVGRRNGSVTVTVTDDGPGIPEERWESIFEPYERAHSTGSQPASVGLGLTVSRQLAHLMGGDLTYRHGPQGSSFELSLPASQLGAG